MGRHIHLDRATKTQKVRAGRRKQSLHDKRAWLKAAKKHFWS